MDIIAIMQKFQTVKLLVRCQEMDNVKCRFMPAEEWKNVMFVEATYDDIWLRDTGPTFLKKRIPNDAGSGAGSNGRSGDVVSDSGNLLAMRWTFNAWGNKHDNYANDMTVSGRIAHSAAVDEVQCPQILEGGSFHTNGNGTFLTTEECLLHSNRGTLIVEDSVFCDKDGEKGRRTKEQMTTVFQQYLNAHKIIWLPYGVHGDDDTDGHVDNIACFISPNKVVLTMPTDCNHVQYSKSMAAKSILESSTDVNGQPLEVICLPHPTGPSMIITEEDVAHLDVGAIDRHVGAQMAGSYINFYIGNSFVVLPQFGSPEDEVAKEILQQHMKHTGHTVFGVNTRAILLGGGNIHCITQQEPSGCL